MVDFSDSFKNLVNGLSLISNPNNNYVMAFGRSGSVLGKMRPEAIVFSEDLVDLGLPSGTLWANKNLGAKSEEDWGWYFSWGNPQPHQEGGGYDFSQANYNQSSGASISTDLSGSNDMATANLGAKWRLPKKDDFTELFNSSYTTNEWTYIELSGGTRVYGRRVTSKSNGNSIFLPASGIYDGTSLEYRGTYGFYSSASRYSVTDEYYLFISASNIFPQNTDDRYYGFSVRAVL